MPISLRSCGVCSGGEQYVKRVARSHNRLLPRYMIETPRPLLIAEDVTSIILVKLLTREHESIILKTFGNFSTSAEILKSFPSLAATAIGAMELRFPNAERYCFVMRSRSTLYMKSAPGLRFVKTYPRNPSSQPRPHTKHVYHTTANLNYGRRRRTTSLF